LTIKKVIQRGRIDVHGTSIFTTLVTIIVSFVLNENKIISFWIIPFSIFLLSPLLGFLFYKLLAKRWILWAFKNVDDLHELKRKAIEECFVWGSDDKFNSTKRFYSKKSKAEWKLIIERIKKTPVFFDDDSIPSETKIYNTRDVENKANPTPQVILNEEGIHVNFTGFYKWSEIKKEKVIVKQSKVGPNCTFYYYHPNGKRTINRACLETKFPIKTF
jgi:hypothetical protein